MVLRREWYGKAAGWRLGFCVRRGSPAGYSFKWLAKTTKEGKRA